MKLITGVIVLSLVLQQPASLNVGGEWAVTLSLPLGDTWFNMFIEQKGTQLTGYMLNESGQFDLKGKIVKDQVTFAWDYPDRGRIINMAFSGKLEKNTLAGTVKLADIAQGQMSAQRK